MYGLGGHAYIYLIYGMHYLLNAVTGEDPCAVLIRAGTPLEGRELLSQNRYGKPYQELTKSQLRAFATALESYPRRWGSPSNKTDGNYANPLIITEGVREKEQLPPAPDWRGLCREAATWPLNFRLVD